MDHLPYSYTMLDERNAACPLTGVDSTWEAIGIDDNEAVFRKGSLEKRITLPFYQGGLCTVRKYPVTPLDAADGSWVDVWLMIPEPTGTKRLEVTLGLEKGLWFALARVA